MNKEEEDCWRRFQYRLKSYPRMKRFLGTNLSPTTDSPPDVIPEIRDAASENDREWFEAHPERTCRVRHAIVGELPNGPRWVVVFQIEPGARIRTALQPDLSDKAISFMIENGQFELVSGVPMWFPDRDLSKKIKDS